MNRLLYACLAVVAWSFAGHSSGGSCCQARFEACARATRDDSAIDRGLVGHWKLRGDCRDYTGLGNHGENHGVDLASSTFDGIRAHIEVPASDTLKFGTGNFTVCARIQTEQNLTDVVGDVIALYDPDRR